MRRGLATACVGLIAACQATTAIERPEIPAGARALLTLGREGSFAADVTGETASSFLVEDPDDFTAIWFSCALERLDLTPGHIPMRADPTDHSAFPVPLAIDVRTASGWTRGDPHEEPELLRRIERPILDRCRAVRGRFKALLPSRRFFSSPAFVVTLKDGTGLMADRTGDAVRVDRTGILEELRVPANIGAAYVAPSGTIWLTRTDATLLRGTLEDGFEVLTSSGAFRGIANTVAMTGPSEVDDPEDIYVAGFGPENRRTFFRFDGTRLRKLAEGERGGVFLPGVTWIRPGEAAMIGIPGFPPSVTRYRDGMTFTERLPFDESMPTETAFFGPASIRHLPHIDKTVVGRDHGEVDHYVDGVWRSMEGNPAPFFSRAIAPVGHGFIVGFSSEVNFIGYRYTQWFPEIGFCEPEDLTPIATGLMSVLGDGSIIAAMVLSFEAPMDVAILALDQPAQRCGE